MSEKPFSRNTIGAIAAGALAANIAVDQVIASETYTTSDPAVIATLLRPRTQDVKVTSEAVAVSVVISGSYKSYLAQPGLGIIPETAYRDMLRKIERDTGTRINGLTMWLTHDHPAGLIKKFHMANGISEQEFRRPEALLNGPAINDCDRYFTSATMSRYNDMPVINLIVEPGGNWVCSSLQSLSQMAPDVEDRYTKIRQKLLRSSQRKTNPMVDVRQFEKDVLKLTGIRIAFVPHGAPLAVFEAARDAVLK